jgi:chromosome segregation ATPase
MAEYQGYVESRIGDAEARLEKMAGKAADARRQELESLAGKSAAIWDAVKERLEKQQEQVAEAMAAVAEKLAEVSAALAGAGAEVEKKVGDLGEPADMLAASVPFMDGLVDKVKETASTLSQVRVSWPH